MSTVSRCQEVAPAPTMAIPFEQGEESCSIPSASRSPSDGPLNVSRLLVNRAAFHDKLYFSYRFNLLCRVALDRNEVCEQAGPYRADLLLHVQRLRGDDRCGAESLHRRHPVIDKQFKLASTVAVCEHADVTAVDDGHACFERRLETIALRLHFLVLGFRWLPTAEVPCVRLSSGERGAIRDVVLRHESEDLDIARVAMLDRLDTRERRPAHPFFRLRVCNDRHPCI